LDLDDYNELVIFGRLRLTLPPVGPYPGEDVLLDPRSVAQHERPLLDLAGSVCTEAWCTGNGTLHLRFSGGHRIEVEADPRDAAWELYGKRHGYSVCLAGGWVRTVRYDIPDDESINEIPSAAI
jgi:hypothetical protein